MTDSEYLMLCNVINQGDMVNGKVMKLGGRWYVKGKRADVPKPIIKLPHWVEGTKRGVVIDQH